MRVTSMVSVLLYICSVALCAEKGNTTRPVASRVIQSSTFTPPQNFKNLNLVHIINLDKGYPRETINAVIQNVASSPQDEYFIPFTSQQMATIGTVEARDKKDLDSGSFDVQAVEFDSQSDTQFYRLKFPKPLAPNAQITVGITFSYLSALHPKPKTIPQAGKQFLVYEFSAYAVSTYVTSKQKTEVKFPGTNVPEYTKVPAVNGAPESPTRAGTKFTYGPFGEISAGTIEPIKVRYEFTKPLIHVSKLERDIEVSHWGGNIAFEERYTLTNRAANLSKQFNRVEWASTAYYNPPTTAIRDLKFPLKVGSLSPYFTDIIGNVSTSRFRSNKHEASLEIKPRYPVFGGWNYPFRVGWDADLKKFLRQLKSGNGYVLNVPFLEGPKQAEGVEYKVIELRVILPEGAKNVKYSTTVPILSSTISLHHTFMDTKGRTALTLNAINIVDELRERELIITYDYPIFAALRKPLFIFSGVLSLFVAAWVVGSLDTSISAKKHV